jgi:hypothetical protein
VQVGAHVGRVVRDDERNLVRPARAVPCREHHLLDRGGAQIVSQLEPFRAGLEGLLGAQGGAAPGSRCATSPSGRPVTAYTPSLSAWSWVSPPITRAPRSSCSNLRCDPVALRLEADSRMPPREGDQMAEETVREATTIEVADLDEIRELAASHGVQVEEIAQPGFEPVTTITLILIGGSLAVASVMAIIERRKGGQVIDLRPGAPKVLYRDKDVVYGLVIILAQDGTVRVEVKQPKELFAQVVEALCKTLLGLASPTVDAVAGAARAVVGGDASVSS